MNGRDDDDGDPRAVSPDHPVRSTASWPALEHCPECGAPGLTPVSDGDETNFLCGSCGLCWHYELGYVARVHPLTCAGCVHRPECLERFAIAERPTT